MIKSFDQKTFQNSKGEILSLGEIISKKITSIAVKYGKNKEFTIKDPDGINLYIRLEVKEIVAIFGDEEQFNATTKGVVIWKQEIAATLVKNDKSFQIGFRRKKLAKIDWE